MQRGSSEHNPRLDDEMAKEVESLVRGAPVEARVDEHRMLEDAADGEPVSESVLSESHEIRERSELAIRLRPSIFPADPNELATCAIEEHAPDDMVDALRNLPALQYQTVNEVWVALGGHAESRDAEPRAEETEPQPASVARFAFEFDWRYRLAALPFGVTPARAVLEIDRTTEPALLRVRFGWWTLATTLDNVRRTHRTGPYAVPKTIGPPHVSLRDRGLTFATAPDNGVCIEFVTPVHALDPFGVFSHPALTVTVADPDGVERALAAASSRFSS